jgi:hypothetical protein
MQFATRLEDVGRFFAPVARDHDGEVMTIGVALCRNER